MCSPASCETWDGERFTRQWKIVDRDSIGRPELARQRYSDDSWKLLTTRFSLIEHWSYYRLAYSIMRFCSFGGRTPSLATGDKIHCESFRTWLSVSWYSNNFPQGTLVWNIRKIFHFFNVSKMHGCKWLLKVTKYSHKLQVTSTPTHLYTSFWVWRLSNCIYEFTFLHRNATVWRIMFSLPIKLSSGDKS